MYPDFMSAFIEKEETSTPLQKEEKSDSTLGIDYSFFKTIYGINIAFELCVNIETNERILNRSQSQFFRQEDIDELQRVFNILQSDFEEMQQYED